MRRTWIGAAAAAAITFGTAGYAVALDEQPSSSQQMRKDRDHPPGDAFTSDKRGERAMTAAPRKSTDAVGPRMGEDQKPKGKVGP
jgi:hypothetical protein